MINQKRYIWVTFRKEGVHCYPAALTDPSLDEVSFLGNPHRHMFHFKVLIEVFHDDREIEFIIFKRWLESLYNDDVLTLSNQSCEMIAENLFNIIEAKYPDRDVTIDISEDGENGACISWTNT